jgi:hypothetical protein
MWIDVKDMNLFCRKEMGKKEKKGIATNFQLTTWYIISFFCHCRVVGNAR